jgi:hypothetical protein
MDLLYSYFNYPVVCSSGGGDITPGLVSFGGGCGPRGGERRSDEIKFMGGICT